MSDEDKAKSRPLTSDETKKLRRWLRIGGVEALWRVGRLIGKAAGRKHADHRDGPGVSREVSLLDMYAGQVSKTGLKVRRLQLERHWRLARLWKKNDVRRAVAVGLTPRYLPELIVLDNAARRLLLAADDSDTVPAEAKRYRARAKLLRRLRIRLVANFKTKIKPLEFRAAIRNALNQIPVTATKQIAARLDAERSPKLARLRLRRFCEALQHQQRETDRRAKELVPAIPKARRTSIAAKAASLSRSIQALEAEIRLALTALSAQEI